MRRVLAIIMMLVLCCMAAFSVCAYAEEPHSTEFNWDDYTLEELVEIQEGLSAKINEMMRAWAIEHGDRVITLTGEEKPVYTGKTTTLSASVEKVLETAPDTTKLVWTSSDPAVATVNTGGVVTGVSKGTRRKKLCLPRSLQRSLPCLRRCNPAFREERSIRQSSAPQARCENRDW